jgi:glycerol-3-phosphate acyltransferase PlsY
MTLLYAIPAIGYLLGSIPCGYLLVKTAAGTDIRTVGSGNIGATNVFRKSRWAGILTLLQSVAAFSAIAGHLFTFWLKFKGGKGVATGCGAYLAMAPVSVGITLAVFVLTLALSRYISLASILATAAFPLWLFLFGTSLPVLLWAIAGSGIIVARHHENIKRLLEGTERRFALGGAQ